MSPFRLLLSCFASAALLAAQAPPPKGPVLEPGEALSIGLGERQESFGDAAAEQPMGGLAELVWLKVEGPEWVARDLRFKCTGELGGALCSRREGHGKVNLGKAMEEGCNLAFLAWGRWSMQRWTEESGDGSARARMEEAFLPFLGLRMPKGNTLPALGLEWVGEGTLLRTSPKAMLQWLLDPMNEGLGEQAMRHLRPIRGLFSKAGEDWWYKTATVPGADPAAPISWVVGSDGQRYAVFHLPKGRTKAEALTRFKALMAIR